MGTWVEKGLVTTVSKNEEGFTLFSFCTKIALRGDRPDRNKGTVNEAIFLGGGTEFGSTLEQLKAFQNTDISFDSDLNGDGLIGGSLLNKSITVALPETQNTIISKQSLVEVAE